MPRVLRGFDLVDAAAPPEAPTHGSKVVPGNVRNLRLLCKTSFHCFDFDGTQLYFRTSASSGVDVGSHGVFERLEADSGLAGCDHAVGTASFDAER